MVSIPCPLGFLYVCSIHRKGSPRERKRTSSRLRVDPQYPMCPVYKPCEKGGAGQGGAGDDETDGYRFSSGEIPYRAHASRNGASTGAVAAIRLPLPDRNAAVRKMNPDLVGAAGYGARLQ